VATRLIRRRRCPGHATGERSVASTHRESLLAVAKTYGSPRLAQVLGCPGKRNRIAGSCAWSDLCPATLEVSPFTTDNRHGGQLLQSCARSIVRRLNQAWTTMPPAYSPLKAGYTWWPFWILSRRVIGWAMSQLLDTALTPRRCAWLLTNATTLKTLSSTPIAEPSSPAPVPTTAQPTWPNRFHESKGKLLRQCLYRELL